MKTEIELDPSEVLRAIKEAQESAKCMLPSAEYEVLPPERQLPSPTREESHDPDVVPPVCEETMARNYHSATSPTDSVGILPEDRPPA
jgi:hypothetical protein